MIAFRVGEEDAVLVEEYGDRCRAYITKTGRFFTFLVRFTDVCLNINHKHFDLA